MIFSLISLVSLFTKTVLDSGGYLFFSFLLSDLQYKGVFCVINFVSFFFFLTLPTYLLLYEPYR